VLRTLSAASTSALPPRHLAKQPTTGCTARLAGSQSACSPSVNSLNTDDWHLPHTLVDNVPQHRLARHGESPSLRMVRHSHAHNLVRTISTSSRAALRAAAGLAAACGPPAPPGFALRAGGRGPAGH
jgi:hypothetical protein